MVFNEVGNLRMKFLKNFRRSRDESGLMAVASCEVLRSNDADRLAAFRLYQQNLAVIVGKIGSLDNLGYERPKFERFVGCLMVENKVYAADLFILCDEVKAPQKFLGNGERRLPYFRCSDLRQNPIENVGHLHGIREIRLERSSFKRTEDFVYRGRPFHFFLAVFFFAALGVLAEPSDFVDEALRGEEIT